MVRLKCFLLFSLLVVSPELFAEEKFTRAKQEYNDLLKKRYVLLPHRGTYLLPLSYNFKPNSDVFSSSGLSDEFQERGPFNKNLELEFQVSFLILTNKDVFNSGFNVFVGYTHQAWWQVYNEDWSRPFRETNYIPELFARKILDEPFSLLGGKFVAYDFGYIHQSNGQIQELSRSWDRVFFRFALAYGSTFVKSTLWLRIPESSSTDDNPDIHEYVGYGDIEVEHLFEKSRVQFKVIPGIKRQGVELSYSYPLREGLRFFLKAGYGYGLSLLDYNNESQKIGFGVALSDFFSSENE